MCVYPNKNYAISVKIMLHTARIPQGFDDLPKDALAPLSLEPQDLFGEYDHDPGQLAFRKALLLKFHCFFQGVTKHGRVEDGILKMRDKICMWFF